MRDAQAGVRPNLPGPLPGLPPHGRAATTWLRPYAGSAKSTGDASTASIPASSENYLDAQALLAIDERMDAGN